MQILHWFLFSWKLSDKSSNCLQKFDTKFSFEKPDIFLQNSKMNLLQKAQVLNKNLTKNSALRISIFFIKILHWVVFLNLNTFMEFRLWVLLSNARCFNVQSKFISNFENSIKFMQSWNRVFLLNAKIFSKFDNEFFFQKRDVFTINRHWVYLPKAPFSHRIWYKI